MGAAMAAIAAKGAMAVPTLEATKSNDGWYGGRRWTMQTEPRQDSLPALVRVTPGACPTHMLLYAASDAAATLVLGLLMESLRLSPHRNGATRGERRYADRLRAYDKWVRDHEYSNQSAPPRPSLSSRVPSPCVPFAPCCC